MTLDQLTATARLAAMRGFFDGTSPKAMADLTTAARQLLNEAPVAYESGS